MEREEGKEMNLGGHAKCMILVNGAWPVSYHFWEWRKSVYADVTLLLMKLPCWYTIGNQLCSCFITSCHTRNMGRKHLAVLTKSFTLELVERKCTVFFTAETETDLQTPVTKYQARASCLWYTSLSFSCDFVFLEAAFWGALLCNA